MKFVIVGTAGHIDHGKSALVRSLTGIDPDRLEEEKRRGITIDLGFAHVDLGDGLKVGFIDVPGHERFVRNMLAGVGGIDLLLLVVAADESIMPQTREHFDICKLLGISKGLVAITKADLVEPEIVDLVKLEVQDFVAGSFLDGAPLVAVSARTGKGIDKLKSELHRLGLEVSTRSTNLPFRLPIDRTFVMKGFGAVVTGTLIAGRIERESEVEIFPLGRRARVRGIEVHNLPAEFAVAGQRTALNLAGVEARELARGMMLAPPELFEASSRMDCVLTLLPSARPLKNRARVHFHCWSSETLAEVVLLESKDLKPGQRTYAQLRLTEPGLYLPGDRFIIRQFSPVTTIGGGVILDSHPSRHRFGDPAVSKSLEIMESGDPQARLELLVNQSGEIDLADLPARTGWQSSKTLALAKILQEQQRLKILGQPPTHLVHLAYFQALGRKTIEELEKFHTERPLDPTTSKEDLRTHVVLSKHARSAAPSPLLFNTVLQQLHVQGKVEVQGEGVRLVGRAVQLSPAEIEAKERICRAFEVAGLSTPSTQEVLATLRIDHARAEKILRILLKEKILLKVAENLIFHRSALEKLKEMITRRKTKNNRIDVSGFKELTGLSRKYAIPLLEYLDRERVTRREGDARLIL